MYRKIRLKTIFYKITALTVVLNLVIANSLYADSIFVRETEDALRPQMVKCTSPGIAEFSVELADVSFSEADVAKEKEKLSRALKNSYRAIILDIDGVVNDELIEKIVEKINRGIYVVLASGRPRKITAAGRKKDKEEEIGDIEEVFKKIRARLGRKNDSLKYLLGFEEDGASGFNGFPIGSSRAREFDLGFKKLDKAIQKEIWEELSKDEGLSDKVEDPRYKKYGLAILLKEEYRKDEQTKSALFKKIDEILKSRNLRLDLMLATNGVDIIFPGIRKLNAIKALYSIFNIPEHQIATVGDQGSPQSNDYSMVERDGGFCVGRYPGPGFLQTSLPLAKGLSGPKASLWLMDNLDFSIAQQPLDIKKARKIQNRVLITGGTGYFGSELARYLIEQGSQVWIIDDESTGHEAAVPSEVKDKARYIKGNICDTELIRKIIEDNGIDVVYHLAAKTLMGESVEKPALYYYTNATGTIVVAEAIRQAQDANPACKVVLAAISTCGVYDSTAPEIKGEGLTEESSVRPTAPYPESKLLAEAILKHYQKKHGVEYVAIRPFNIVGASENGQYGEDTGHPTHLITVAGDVVTGKQDKMTIFGKDWTKNMVPEAKLSPDKLKEFNIPTDEDLTAVREYIWVGDMCVLTFRAANYVREQLKDGKDVEHRVFSGGTGEPLSALRVIVPVFQKAIELGMLEEMPEIGFGPRRDGDDAVKKADMSLAKKELDWQPTASIEEIVETHLRFLQKKPGGYRDDKSAYRDISEKDALDNIMQMLATYKDLPDELKREILYRTMTDLVIAAIRCDKTVDDLLTRKGQRSDFQITRGNILRDTELLDEALEDSSLRDEFCKTVDMADRADTLALALRASKYLRLDDYSKKLETKIKRLTNDYNGVRGLTPKSFDGDLLKEYKQGAEIFLLQYGQEHILRYWNELEPAGKKKLLLQIAETDWDTLMSLYQTHVVEGEKGVVIEGEFKPAIPIQIEEREKTPEGKKRNEEAKEIGEKALKWGADEDKAKHGIAVGAGGKGSGLGLVDRPKGAFDSVLPLSECSFYEIGVKRAKAAAVKYGHKRIYPYMLMTSSDTHEDTKEFFLENNFFDESPDRFIFAPQQYMPAVDKNGKVILKAKHIITTGGTGHGDIFDYVLNPDAHAEGEVWNAKQGCWEKHEVASWLNNLGVEHMQFTDVADPLRPLANPYFTGEHILSKKQAPKPGESPEVRAHISLGMISKEATERLGNVVIVKGPRGTDLKESVDYGDASPEVKTACAWGDPTMRLVEWRTLKGSDSIPFSVARNKRYIDLNGKKVMANKFERSSGDKKRYGAEFAFDWKETFAPVKYSDERAPDKRPPGDTTPTTVKERLSEHWKRKLEQLGYQMDDSTVVELPWDVEYMDQADLQTQLQKAGLPKQLEPSAGYLVKDGFSGLVKSSSAGRAVPETLQKITELLETKNIESMIKADDMMDNIFMDPDADPELKKGVKAFIEPEAGQPPVIRVIRTKPKAQQETIEVPEAVKGRVGRRVPFDVNSKEDFLELANEIFPALVANGVIKPVVLINMKQISEMSNVAYGGYLRNLSTKYNGNITFILAIEHKTDLKHDLPGMANLVNNTVDTFGEDFIKNNLILSMLDAGLKERWANLTPRYGQSGTGPARRGDNYIEQNMNTLGALSLVYPDLGSQDIFNIGSDSDSVIGDTFIGGKKPKDLDDDRNMVFYGIKRQVLDEAEVALIAEYLERDDTKKLDNDEARWNEICSRPAVRSILKNIEDRELHKRGIFFVNQNANPEPFAEKIPAAKILRETYQNTLTLKTKTGSLYENLWLISYDKSAFLNFARRLKDTPASAELQQKSEGRITNLSQLEVSTFQIAVGGRFMDDDKWDETCRKLMGDERRPVTKEDLDKLREIACESLPTEKIYGGDYGKGSEAEDTGNLANTLKAWEKERGKGLVNTPVFKTEVILGEDATVEDSLITGSGKLIVDDGAVIKNSHIHVAWEKTMIIPPADKAGGKGAVIVDSYLADNVKFVKGDGGYLVMGVWFAPKRARDLTTDGEWSSIDTLNVYPDESITTIGLGHEYYITRDIVSVDFKGRKIGKIIPQKDWQAWVKRHPCILGVRGISEDYPSVKDKEFIGLKKYPFGKDVIWARKNTNLLKQQKLTRILRGEIEDLAKIARMLIECFESPTEARLRTVINMYTEGDLAKRTIMDTVLNSTLFHLNPQVRWSARWVSGELIGIPVQSMLEAEDRTNEVVYSYLKCWAMSMDKQKNIIDNIIESSLLEPEMTNIKRAASWVKERINSIKGELEGKDEFRSRMSRILDVDSLFHSESLETIRYRPNTKALWAILYLIVECSYDCPEELQKTLIAVIDSLDKGEFESLGYSQAMDKLNDIARSCRVLPDSEMWRDFIGGFAPDFESIQAHIGIPAAERDKAWSGYNVKETIEAVKGILADTRPDIPEERIDKIIMAHTHAHPKFVKAPKRTRRFSEQVALLYDLGKIPDAVLIHNPYERPGEPSPTGARDMTEVAVTAKNIPGILGRESTNIGKLKGNIIVPDGYWSVDIGRIKGVDYNVYVFEIEKEKVGGGRFKDPSPAIDYYKKQGKRVFTVKRDAKGQVSLKEETGSAVSLLEEIESGKDILDALNIAA